MNKRRLSTISAFLVGLYSQLLHLVAQALQLQFDSLPALIGVLASVASYFTLLVLIFINLPNLETFLADMKIKRYIKSLEKEKKQHPPDSSEWLDIEQRRIQYTRLRRDNKEKELQKLLKDEA